MRIPICSLVVLLAISCSDFECPDIKEAIKVRCVQGEFERESAFWDCLNDDTVNCEKTAICINQFQGCDLVAIESCLTGYRKCAPTDCGTAAILDCPDSPYYHSDPENPEGGNSYVLSEAFSGCTDYQVTVEPDGHHAWVCLDGECVLPADIETTVCGMRD